MHQTFHRVAGITHLLFELKYQTFTPGLGNKLTVLCFIVLVIERGDVLVNNEQE